MNEDRPAFTRADWEYAVGYARTATQARLAALEARCEAGEARLAALEAWQRQQDAPAVEPDPEPEPEPGRALAVTSPNGTWLLMHPSALARSVCWLPCGARLSALSTASDGARLYARVTDDAGRPGYVALADTAAAS